MTDWEEVRALEPLHILKESVVREQFSTDKAPGVHVAFVEVFRLDPVWRFADSKAYGGCRSWVDLPTPPADLQPRPVRRQRSALIEGGCLCGGVRYRLTAEPERLCDCHCIDCRRASAAPFVTWGTVRKNDLGCSLASCAKSITLVGCGRLRPVAERHFSFSTTSRLKRSTWRSRRSISRNAIFPRW